MAQQFAKKFYRSKEWLKCRRAFISQRESIDGGMCMRCGERPGYIVHHTIYLTPENINDPNVSLNFRNLEYVCQECHNEEHNPPPAQGLVRYAFSDAGDPVPLALGK